MNGNEFYAHYAERKISEQYKQISTRAYVFLAIDVLLFIAHATFLSMDMTLEQVIVTEPSFLHLVTHLLSLILLIICMFFQIYLYNIMIAGSMNTTFHTKFMEIVDATRKDGPAAIKLAHESVYQDMAAMEESAKKALRYLDMVEYFTCGACCLLLLIPI